MAEQIVIQGQAPAEDPAHVAAMVKVVDDRAAALEPAPPVASAGTPKTRPEGVPEKFWDAEKGEVKVDDLAKSYTELEKAKGTTPKIPELNADGTPKVPEVKPELNADGTPKVPDAAAQELANKGLDLGEFTAEFDKAGALAPESYDKLEKAGYPKAIVDNYIAGQMAVAAQYQAEVKSAAGGEAQFDEVVTWAAENLTEPEKLAYNAAIDSGDVAKAKLAVAGITQKFQAVRPNEGKLLAGGGGATNSGDVYESLAQMQVDMADPKYKTDPAFRAKVATKIGRSNIL